MKNKTSTVISSVLLLSMILGCKQLSKPIRKESPDIRISAEELAEEYNKDRAAASSKFDGKTLAITGRVDQKMYGSTLVFATSRQHDFIVQCFFDKEDHDSYQKIRNKAEVTMLGLCNGRDGQNGPLQISHCKLVD